MDWVRRLASGAWLVLAMVGSAHADCVPMAQMRDLIGTGEVIPLLSAVRAARGATPGEMIDGRLCHAGHGYQYVVTFLAADGRVIRVLVDAQTGSVAGVR